jgi:DNA (cytosine-5)-methyltransferase 1
MNYLSVCSGIEAASVAWHPLGWTPIGFSEIEPFPSAVLAHHFPTVKNFGDMTKYDKWDIKRGTVDLLVGGTPCQSFSVAGLRQGLKDPRGNLMLTFLGIAEHFNSKWIVWENVPGVLSSNGGKDFGSFLGALGELGYGFAYRVIDAQWVRTYGHPRAVPQRRRRVFVVGCFGNAIRAAKVLFESESLPRYSAPRRATRKGTAADVEEGVGSGDEVVKHPVIFTKAKRAQSSFDNETWVQGVVAPTQNTFDVGDTRATTAILFENHPNDSRVTGPHNVAPSCVSRFGTGGGNVPLVISAVAIQGTVIGRKDYNGPQGLGCSDGGEMFTLNSTDVHAVALAPTMQVRRLTPTECERLQGFPDGWTAIPWKNKSANDCPDGPRYKALGNSMAVNCMEWLGERIKKFNNEEKNV